jgi:integrase
MLSSAFHEAQRRGYITQNPVELSDGIKLNAERRPVFTAVDAKRFLAYVAKEWGPKYIALYTLAIHTGLRIGEISALRWSDVDLDAKTVTVAGTIDGVSHKRTEPKTEGSVRTITVTSQVIETLKAHKAEWTRRHGEQQADGLVFLSRFGTPLVGKNVRLHFQGCCEVLGLHVDSTGKPLMHLHDLRHSCATILLDAGEQLATVSALLGHKSIQTTAGIYRHVSAETTRSAATRLESVLS